MSKQKKVVELKVYYMAWWTPKDLSLSSAFHIVLCTSGFSRWILSVLAYFIGIWNSFFITSELSCHRHRSFYPNSLKEMQNKILWPWFDDDSMMNLPYLDDNDKCLVPLEVVRCIRCKDYTYNICSIHVL